MFVLYARRSSSNPILTYIKQIFLCAYRSLCSFNFHSFPAYVEISRFVNIYSTFARARRKKSATSCFHPVKLRRVEREKRARRAWKSDKFLSTRRDISFTSGEGWSFCLSLAWSAQISRMITEQTLHEFIVERSLSPTVYCFTSRRDEIYALLLF